MTMKTIVAEGVWCTTCEFFEDHLGLVGGHCRACGCATAEHIEAQVLEVTPLRPDQIDIVSLEELWAGLTPEQRADARGKFIEKFPDPELPIHRTSANIGVVCATCDGGGCLDCTDPA